MGKQYYERLRIYTGDKYPFVTEQVPDGILNAVEQGISFNPKHKIKVPLSSQSKPLPDILGRSTVPVVSEKLRNILLSLVDSGYFEFVECVIVGRKNPFWILNIKDNVECFDWQSSKYRTYKSNPKVIAEIEEIVMLVEKVGDRNIFRMKEFEQSLFISDYLIELFEKEKITGYKVSSTNDFRYP